MRSEMSSGETDRLCGVYGSYLVLYVKEITNFICYIFTNVSQLYWCKQKLLTECSILLNFIKANFFLVFHPRKQLFLMRAWLATTVKLKICDPSVTVISLESQYLYQN